MTDPTFTTRAELEAWVEQDLRELRCDKPGWGERLDRIRRVTLAHAHLIEETKP